MILARYILDQLRASIDRDNVTGTREALANRPQRMADLERRVRDANDAARRAADDVSYGGDRDFYEVRYQLIVSERDAMRNELERLRNADPRTPLPEEFSPTNPTFGAIWIIALIAVAAFFLVREGARGIATIVFLAIAGFGLLRINAMQAERRISSQLLFIVAGVLILCGLGAIWN